MLANALGQFISLVLPVISSICEIMGIFVVTVSVVRAFWLYCAAGFARRPNNKVKFELIDGLATSLSFKMAAEILKTVLVRDLEELIVLGAVLSLRALMSLLIHFEMKDEHKHVQQAGAESSLDRDTANL